MPWSILANSSMTNSMKTKPDDIAPAGDAVLSGHGVGPGIVIGVACLHEPGDVHAPEHRILASRVDAEKKRFATAVADASTELETLREKAGDLPAQAGEELGFLLDAYGHMLVASGRWREDFCYRVNGIALSLPPLRERGRYVT